MKIPFLTSSGDQPAWNPTLNDYVRFKQHNVVPIPLVIKEDDSLTVDVPLSEDPKRQPPKPEIQYREIPLELPDFMEPFRDSVGVITKVYTKSYEKGYVMVAFIPDDIELEDVIQDTEDLRRFFHLRATMLEKVTLVDQDTMDRFEAINERLEQEQREEDDSEDPAEPAPLPALPDKPPPMPAPAQAEAVPEEPLNTDAVAQKSTAG